MRKGNRLLGRDTGDRGATGGRGATGTHGAHATAAHGATAMTLAAAHAVAETLCQFRGDLTGFQTESRAFLLHLVPEGVEFFLLGGDSLFVGLFGLFTKVPSGVGSSGFIRLFGLPQGRQLRVLDHHLFAHISGVSP